MTFFTPQFLFILFLFISVVLLVWYFFAVKSKNKAYYNKTVRDWSIRWANKPRHPLHSVFLIGDTGMPETEIPDPNLALLEKKLEEGGANSTVVFLGDIIYPNGLPEKDAFHYQRSEKRLLAQLDILKHYKGNIFFLSGNHDWKKSREGGLESVNRQQDFIEAYLKRDHIYLPANGCPGPVEIPLSAEITLIIINSSWWVHKGFKPIGREFGCVESEEGFFELLEEMLARNSHKQVLIAAHHPIYSKSYHGGKFDLHTHLFPLTFLHKKLFIPIPVLGSLYPIYRKFYGALEDISHPKYKRLRRRLKRALQPYENLIYACGHDHNLQYINKYGNHFIVSGSGSKTTYVKRGGSALFTHAHLGFFKLEFHEQKQVWMEVWEPDEEVSSGKMAFRKQIIGKEIS